jgi:Bifunctional DNA primase/polymerase, N-terminal
MNTRQQQAISLLDAGLSIIPMRPDGSKAPTVKWERYQHERSSPTDVLRWFASMRSGIGIVGGMISGGLEILDFDDAEVFEPWQNLVNQVYEGVTQQMPIVQTPTGGFHVYYQANRIQGNQKLARRHETGKPVDVRIETRGEGGYVLSPYCHPDCHPTRQRYRLLHGDLTRVPLISQQAREVLMNSARAFNEVVDLPKRPVPQKSQAHGERPGDLFNATVSWFEILEPHGWRAVHTSGGKTYWKRAEKREHGWSATTGHDGRDVLYVFSSNAAPFELNKGYSKFTAYVLLNFRGDFHAAALSLIGTMK